jgi:hypothetical protein
MATVGNLLAKSESTLDIFPFISLISEAKITVIIN